VCSLFDWQQERRVNRAKIFEFVNIRPANANQIATELKLDYNFIVPAEISPLLALARSDDRNIIILFSETIGLFLANPIIAVGDFASVLFRNAISLL
jgi:hypothetical protein